MPARPILLGHRGARATTIIAENRIAENTAASFDLALEHGCDGFEFDVRLTADRAAVVCHDASWRGLRLSRATRTQLGLLPGLETVLRRYHRRAFLDIELKVAGLEGMVLQTLSANPPQRDYVVSSFLPPVVRELRARNASVSLGIICDKPRQLARWPQLEVDYVIIEHSLAEPTLVEEVQSAGKKLLVWTVNDRRAMLRLARWGVDGIISDDTELLVRTLGKAARRDDNERM
jgi:glycerophosphoryl diester phosphodiesterase